MHMKICFIYKYSFCVDFELFSSKSLSYLLRKPSPPIYAPRQPNIISHYYKIVSDFNNVENTQYTALKLDR